jgi:hypothetical protein
MRQGATAKFRLGVLALVGHGRIHTQLTVIASQNGPAKGSLSVRRLEGRSRVEGFGSLGQVVPRSVPSLRRILRVYQLLLTVKQARVVLLLLPHQRCHGPRHDTTHPEPRRQQSPNKQTLSTDTDFRGKRINATTVTSPQQPSNRMGSSATEPTIGEYQWTEGHFFSLLLLLVLQ